MNKAAWEKLCKERPHDFTEYETRKPHPTNSGYALVYKHTKCKWCHFDVQFELKDVLSIPNHRPCLSDDEKIIKRLLE